MIKTKPFKQLVSVGSWFNRPDNRRLRLVSVLREAIDTFTAVYEEPDPEEDADLRNSRIKLLAARIKTHLGYPQKTKKALKFPEGILHFEVVPLARIRNSMRNLGAFKGMSLKEQSDWIVATAPTLGYKILTRSEAKEEYNTDATLISKI